MQQRPTVWVIREQVRNSNPMDYSSAERYGDLRFITRSELPIGRDWKDRPSADAIFDQIRQFLTQIQKGDYLILTGSPTMMFMMGAICWRSVRTKFPTILVWNRDRGEYFPMQNGDLWINEFPLESK